MQNIDIKIPPIPINTYSLTVFQFLLHCLKTVKNLCHTEAKYLCIHVCDF